MSAVGLAPAVLAGLRAADARTLGRVLSVYVGTPAEGTPAIAGALAVDDEGVHFTPLFRFDAGRAYTVRLQVHDTRIERAFTVAPAAAGEAPRVTAVHPAGGTLPENALRLYVHFSRPMATRDAMRFVHLQEADGRDVPLAFVEVGGGLWDPAATRLTLLFHPGRVKRGIAPGERLGPPLRAGRAYRLVIDGAMADATGTPLGQPFAHPFEATAADRQPPLASGIRLTAPERPDAPLAIAWPEPLDHGLLLRWVWVEDGTGTRVEGAMDVDADETRSTFRPDAPWPPGRYALRVAAELEDRAGNRFDRPFDRDLSQPAGDPAPLRVTFDVR